MDIREQVDRLRAQLRRWDGERRAEARANRLDRLGSSGRVEDGNGRQPEKYEAEDSSGGVGCGVARGGVEQEGWSVIGSGCEALDRLLPLGGFVRGALAEFWGETGGGAATLALVAAREAGRSGRPIVIVDGCRSFYPPAAFGWGIEPRGLLVVRPADARDALWAADQILRCSAVSAAWISIDRLDSRSFRRLQLAAESSGTPGFLVRCSNRDPPSVDGASGGSPRAARRDEPSWADVRLRIVPIASDQSAMILSPVRRFEVQLARCRHGRAGGKVVLELDEVTGDLREVNRHATLPLSMVPALADPAPSRGGDDSDRAIAR
ncbi:MAG: hypothetical protein FJ297_07260 [Planctomycetes bacterium]|nr:hypothetical protein [Planctomycetota bacterium]